MPLEESIALHVSYARTMRSVWRYHPVLEFMIVKGDDIVAFGGWLIGHRPPDNDRLFTPPLL